MKGRDYLYQFETGTVPLETPCHQFARDLLNTKSISVRMNYGSQLQKIYLKKSRFFTCHCHKIYRVEAIGFLSLSNYCTFKFMIFVCGMWDNFVKNYPTLKSLNLKILLHIYLTHIIVIIYCTPHFVSIWFIFTNT